MRLVWSRCLSCEEPAGLGSFPYCELCLETLVNAPAPCSRCGTLACSRASCEDPEQNQTLGAPLRTRPLRSLEARYLAVAAGHATIRAWKSHSGPWSDRRILRSDPALLDRLKGKSLDGIVPIPQSFRRARQLGGSPPARIAQWLSDALKLPCMPALEIRPDAPGGKQAQRRLTDRQTTARRFIVRPELRSALTQRRWLVVDDLVTSGRTLNDAADALLDAGALEVHAFALGYRPYRLSSTAQSRRAQEEAEAGPA